MQSTIGSRAFQNARLQKKSRKQADMLTPTAVAAYRAGKHAEAQTICGQILGLVPDHFHALHLLGVSALDGGRLDLAEQALTQAVAAEPRNVEALANLGLVLFRQKRYQEARKVQESAIAFKPNFATALTSLGNTLMRLLELEQAVEAHDRAIALKPDYADAYCNRGMAQLPLNRSAEANQSFDRALSFNPRHMEAMFGKGLAGINLRHFDDALAAFNAALAIKPHTALVVAQRGRLYQQVGRFDQAEADFDAALAIDPLLEAALLGKAQLGVIKDNIAAAMEACRKVLEQNPASEIAWTWLAACFVKQGEIPTALQHFDRALEIKPDYAEAITAKLFALDFLPEADFAMHQAARREWWNRIGVRLPRCRLQRQDLDPERRIVVGYVSSDFRNHSAALAFLPVLRNHDRKAFAVVCYSCSPLHDAMTEQCRSSAETWVEAWQLSDDELADRIQSDHVDILVDLSGHSAGNRLAVFARKPAPIQVSGWGHPTGTGLSTMDYVLADPVSIPESARPLFVERIYDLPCMITMEAPRVAIRPDPPMLRNGYVTFGVFNRIEKISDRALALWSRLLQAVPGAKILIKHGALDVQLLRDGLIARFVAHGIPQSSVMCMGLTQRHEHLMAFESIDISLDPFPQNGGASTWESLHMGVPVVTKLGSFASSRAGGAVVKAVGLDDWVAEDDDGYIAIASKFASQPGHLQALRAELPGRIAASAAGNVELYTRHVENGYRELWRRYCVRSS